MIQCDQSIIIRVPNWIGDVVMALGGISALRQLRPEANITVLAKPWVKDVLIHHPAIDDLLIHNPRHFPGRVFDFFHTVRNLRHGAFDTGLLFHKNFESALLFRCAGIPERVGRPTDNRGILLTQPIVLDEETLNGHQVYHYMEIVEQYTNLIAPKPDIKVYLSDSETSVAKDYLDLLGTREYGEGPVIPIAAGAAYGVAKCWPSHKVVELINMIGTRLGGQVILLGGPGEVESNQRIIAECKENVVSVAGCFSLLEQAALVRMAGVCIANDSGLMHVASALEGVKVIALFGPTKPRETAPFGTGHIVLHHVVDCWPCKHRTCPRDHRCLELISSEIVLNAVESLLP